MSVIVFLHSYVVFKVPLGDGLSNTIDKLLIADHNSCITKPYTQVTQTLMKEESIQGFLTWNTAGSKNPSKFIRFLRTKTHGDWPKPSASSRRPAQPPWAKPFQWNINLNRKRQEDLERADGLKNQLPLSCKLKQTWAAKNCEASSLISNLCSLTA